MDDLTLGIRAFQKGRYEEARERLEALAEGGELRAQQIMARMYYKGNGVEKDRKKYIYWLQLAAENGDKAAKSWLKRMDREGNGNGSIGSP